MGGGGPFPAVAAELGEDWLGFSTMSVVRACFLREQHRGDGGLINRVTFLDLPQIPE